MKKKNRTQMAFLIAVFIVAVAFAISVVLIMNNNRAVNDLNATSSNETVVSENIIPAVSVDTARETVGKGASLNREDTLRLYNAYASALASICEGGIWIDDKSNKVCSYLQYWNYANKDAKSRNNFAILDIDDDGIDELVVEVNNASVADKITVIYQYDLKNNTFIREASFFPGAVFYNNDIVFDEWSHNQGNGNFIWPYSVYKYDRAEDTYNFISQVDSWNKEIKADGFPDEIDQDGDGNIVIISSAEETLYLDNDQYYEWITKITDGTTQKEIEFMQIFSANYSNYSKDYINYVIESAVEANSVNGTDIGIIYASSEDSIGAVKEELEAKYGIKFGKSKNKAYKNAAVMDDKCLFGISSKDANVLVYENAYSDICVFGIYPGIKEKLAMSYLSDYGFTGGDLGVYKLGSDGWHVEVIIKCEAGEVTSVSIGWNSDFAK